MGGQYDSSLTRVQPFFEQAFARDGWLSNLLAASPHGRQVLGDLVDAPGEMLSALTRAHPKGKARLACFEHEVLPDKAFLMWCAVNPSELTWPPGQTYGEETTK